jgi:hypothetical protein
VLPTKQKLLVVPLWIVGVGFAALFRLMLFGSHNKKTEHSCDHRAQYQ